MFEIIGILAVGIIAGRILRSNTWPAKIAGLVTVTVCILVFVLGFTVGAAPAVNNDLLGVMADAVTLTALGLAGSFAAVFILKKSLRRES